MKVAVCISGAFRGNYESSLESIYNNLVEPLKADVFIETWDNYYEWPGVCGGNFINRLFGNNLSKTAPKCISDERSFKENLPNTYVKLSTAIVKPFQSESVFKKFKVCSLNVNSESFFNDNILSKMDTSGMFVPNQYRMFFLLYKANQAMHIQEKAMNINYDLIIRIRPDVHFINNINVSDLYKVNKNSVLTKMIIHGIDDALFIAKPETMDTILSLWEQTTFTRKLSPFKNYKFRAHPLLQFWLIKNEISVQTFEYNISIQKVIENYIPDISCEIKQDLDILKNNKHQFYNQISIWLDSVLKQFDRKYI